MKFGISQHHQTTTMTEAAAAPTGLNTANFGHDKIQAVGAYAQLLVVLIFAYWRWTLTSVDAIQQGLLLES